MLPHPEEVVSVRDCRQHPAQLPAGEIRKDGQEIELSKTEQKLLRMLVENRGVTLSRAKLVDAIWTDGAEYVDENALSVAIKRLRNKIEVTPSKPKYIQTVYGIGYVWREGE